VASERYSDPGISNVLEATTYKFNSETDNRTGTYEVPEFPVSTDPGQSNVKIGVAYTIEDVSKLGTYDGSDRFDTLPVEKVLYAEEYLANAVTYTGTLIAPPTDLRGTVNQILRFTGEPSVTDEEFEDLDITLESTTDELYAALVILLESRDAVSTSVIRLEAYFKAKGITLTIDPPVTSSRIIMGSVLEDETLVEDENSNIFLGGDLGD
jgi:hypothetical protein